MLQHLFQCQLAITAAPFPRHNGVADVPEHVRG
jgi:hypothetical protein